MRNSIKKIIVSFGMSDLLRMTNRTPRVLVWHSVDYILNPIVEAEGINIKSFAEQIQYLRKHYDIVSMDEFYHRYSLNIFNGHEITLTFDDGYKNNLWIVAPILKTLSIPFTVFVSTNHITSGEIFPTSLTRLIIYGAQKNIINIPSINIRFQLKTENQRFSIISQLSSIIKTSPNSLVKQISNELVSNISQDEFHSLLSTYKSILPLNWDEVRGLQKQGCTIGSHCMDHYCCHNVQNNQETEFQILNSKHIIEKEIGSQCQYFAYPNGNYTDFSNRCVSKAGYWLAFSTERQRISPFNENLKCIPRIQIPEDINAFKLHINFYPKHT